MPSKVPIQATKTLFDIFEILAREDGAGVSELADRFDKPSSTVHDYLRSLESIGYVINEGGYYRLSMRFLGLGVLARSHLEIYETAAPELKKLASETGEHANLMIEEQGYGILLHTVMGENAVEVVAYDGSRSYLHVTAPGKAILAYLPDERVEDIIDIHGLPAVTEHTITDREKLYDQFKRIHEQGYALDKEEAIEGMWGVAAPLLRRTDDTILGAISVYGPANRLTAEEFEEEVPTMVLRAANVIEINATRSYSPSV